MAKSSKTPNFTPVVTATGETESAPSVLSQPFKFLGIK